MRITLRDRLQGLMERLPEFDSQAVLYAYIAGLITGWLWYAVAGSVWKASVTGAAAGLNSPRRYIFSAIAQIAMTIMLAMVIQRLGVTGTLAGLQTAVMLWFGFVMTTILVNYANLGQRLILTLVDGAHWLLVLAVMGAVIGALATPQPIASAPATPAATAPANPVTTTTTTP